MTEESKLAWENRELRMQLDQLKAAQPKAIEEVMKLMKANGVQRLSVGNLNIEMRWETTPQKTGIPL